MVKRLRNAVIYFLCSLLVVQLLFPTVSDKASASVADDAILGMRIVTRPVYAQDNSRPRPFNGRTGTNHACLGIKQTGKANYEVSYCIDYALGAWSNDYLTSDYKNMTDEQKVLLNYTLLYGFNSAIVKFDQMKKDEINKYFATQTLVWIIREGYFYKDAEREKIEKFLVDDMFPDSRKIYDDLYEKVKYMVEVPSYATKTQTTCNVHTMKWNESTKKYEVTLTNSLKKGGYTSSTGLTVDKTTLPSGVTVNIKDEKIVISSANTIPDVKTIRFIKDPGVKGKVVAWRNSVTTRQSMVTLDYDEKPIEVDCFVNIQTEALSNIKIVTTSTDKVVKDIVYNVGSTTYTGNKTFTTDKSGIIIMGQLLPGTYTITQVQNNLAEYIPVVEQKVTIGSNETKTVTFNNKRKKIRVDITKIYDDAEDSELKNGSVYGVYKDGTKISDVTIKDGKGVSEYSFFEAKAVYTVKEIKAAEGSKLDETVYTLDTTPVKESKEENNTVYVKYTGEAIKNSVTVNLTLEKNYWQESDLPGANVEFKATDKKTGKSVTEKTDAKGQVVFKDLKYSTYVIEQTTVPEGYIKDASFEVNVTTSAEGQYVYNKYNKLIRGSVSINKTLEKNEYEAAINKENKYGEKVMFVASPVVNGAVEKKVVLQSEATDKNGKTSIANLTYGVWQISEVAETVPTGYEAMSATTIEIKENGKAVVLDVENKLIRGSLSIINILEKTDRDFMSGDKYAEGVQFIARPVVDGQVKNDGMIKLDLTDVNGQTIYKNIGFGDWQIVQVAKTLPKGYIEAEPINIAITKDKKDVIVNVLNLSMKGKVFVTVYDSVNKQPISGCEVEIYNSNGDKVFNGVTDEIGDISTMVNYGEYKVKVVKVPKEYVLNNAETEFAITANNQTVEKKAYLDRVKGTLTIVKLGDTDKKRLPGTEYTVYNKDGTEIGKYVTDKNGELSMGPLEYGDYYFVETKAPDGYEPDKTKYEFSITEDGQVVSKVLTGKMIALTPVQSKPETMKEQAKDVVEVKEEEMALDSTPKTGDNSKLSTFVKNMIASGATIVLMIVTEVVSKKKRKKAL
ncbi:MAG: hypothetical protein E7262_11445 [Lachnospiraceae bacterium]|nr:hypothetical protein [Lachnospiraceae bacterium]